MLSAQFRKQHLQKKLVFGLGQTGFSCVRFLVQHGFEVAVFDTRANPPLAEQLYREFPNVELTLQSVSEALFEDVDQIVLSPGISVKSPLLTVANDRNIRIVGDIELFALCAQAPVIGITGSNGKTTTTTLIAEMFSSAGLKVETGGNIGTPVLDLLNRPVPDYYVLELSSFQLETTRSLTPYVALILNISADHMDRYENLKEYGDAKFSILNGAHHKLINIDDPWLKTQLEKINGYVGFTENSPEKGTYGLLSSDGLLWIASANRKIFKVTELKLQGRHQLMNAVAAAAVADLCKINKQVIAKVLSQFNGLEHRTQLVATVNGVNYINDSKGTNIGATIAAINGLDSTIILIAGGDGKGADFSELAGGVKDKVRYAILFGRDAGKIEKAIGQVTNVMRAVNLESAVSQASEIAVKGETVLLSPACASFDMFDNYQHRGDVFIEAVRGLE